MFIFAIGVFFTKIISFFFVPIYSKYLSAQEFGDVDILTTSASLAIPIFTLAITEAVIKYGIDDKSDLKKVFSTCLIITLFGTVTMSLSLLVIGQYIYSDYLLVTILFFTTECLFLFLQAFAKALKNTVAYVISSIIYSVISTILIIVFIVIKDFGVNGYMIGMSAGTLAAIIYLSIVCKTWKYLSLKSVNKNSLFKMISYSAPLALSNVGYWAITGSDKYITKILMGDDATAYLSMIHKIPTLCTLLFSIFNYAYAMSALKDHQITEETTKEDTIFYSKLFNYVILMLVFGCLLVSFLSQGIASLYANIYWSYWIYIPLYSFGVVLGSFRSFYTSIYCVKEKTIKIMGIIFVGAAINIILCYTLMKYTGLGLWATAISTIACNSFIFIFYYFDSRRYIRIKLNKSEIISLTSCFISAVLPILIGNKPYLFYPTLFLLTSLVFFLNAKKIKELIKSIFIKNK